MALARRSRRRSNWRLYLALAAALTLLGIVRNAGPSVEAASWLAPPHTTSRPACELPHLD